MNIDIANALCCPSQSNFKALNFQGSAKAAVMTSLIHHLIIDCGLSKEMFYIWRDYHHKISNDEIIARNWNGGPRGYKKQSTEHYWHKVQLQWAN